MKSNAARWLAALVAAAACTIVLPSLQAEESGPARAESATPTATTPSVKSERAKRDTYPFRGVIASFDSEARLLKLEGREKSRAVHLTDRTRLNRDGQTVLLADLKPGETVGGALRRTADGREEAVMIRIGPKPETPAGSASPAKSGSKRAMTGE